VSDQIEARSIEDLLYALDECFDGEGAEGGVFLNEDEPGLFAMLNALDAERASEPTAGASVANHVCHLIFAIDVFVRRIGGKIGEKSDRPSVPPRPFALNENADPFDVDWKMSWRERPVDAAGWEALKKDLADRRRDAESLAREHGARHPRLVSALLTHTVFHLGIIRVKFDVLTDSN
jgi:hypothetical protein